MRYAIFSDVHANLIAWEAVRRDLGPREADVLICLGDIVGYGPRPMETLESILAVTQNILMGNHDAASVGAMDSSIFNERAQRSTAWTAKSLTEEARTFLANLPLAMESEGILFVHAEVCHPERFGYINGPIEALENFLAGKHHITFIGHTHFPKLFEWDGSGEVVEFPAESRALDPAKRYIVNVGTVGEPRDPHDLRARYVIYDTERAMVEFHAVGFNIAACRVDLERTDLGIKPFFLRVFEQSAVDTQQSLLTEAPASPLLRPAGKVGITQRLQLNPNAARAAMQRRPAPPPQTSTASAKPSKSNKGLRVFFIFLFLFVAGGVSWLLLPPQTRSQETAKPEENKPLATVVPSPPSIPSAAQTDSSLPKTIPTPTKSSASLKISVVTVGDTVPALDNAYGTLELAYNFGYSGSEVSQDGIKFQSITHTLVPAPVFGTTRGITVKGSSKAAPPNFNTADLGHDLWQTITYTDRGDDLRLEVTGLIPKKSYQFQILLGEPRNNRTTLYNNGTITATDTSGASQSTYLTFGNKEGDYALIKIEMAGSDSLFFDMPKAGLGPGVAGMVIHSLP